METSTAEVNIQTVAMDLIDAPSINMRILTTTQAIDELAESIALNGLLQPITLNRRGDRFEIVAGFRRYLAHQKLGYGEILAIVREMGEQEMLISRFIENAERKDAEPLEEAQYLLQMKSRLRVSQRELAKIIGRSESYVSDRINIVDYPEDVKEALRSKGINFSVAREFAKIDNAKVRGAYLNYAITSGCSPDAAKNWRRQYENENVSEADFEEGFAAEGGGMPLPMQKIYVGCQVCQTPWEPHQLKNMSVCPHCIEALNNVELEDKNG